MSLKDQITDDMKAAMRAKAGERLTTIRLLLAAIKQKEIDERVTLDDAAVLAVVEKLVKQRKDSVAAYTQAARQDLVDKENAEIEVLKAYLPAQLGDAEVEAVVRELIASTGASSPADMGKVMGAAKTRLAGQADMGRVSALIKAALKP